jgi:hypothetical protein
VAELDRYLEQLRAELPLPPAVRDEAIEEIASHIADATAELVAHGVDADSAQRRVISRFGEPGRLADRLAAARRGRWQLATAVGAALRTSLRTGFWAIAVGGATLYVAALVAMGAIRTLGSVLGADLSAIAGAGPRTSILFGSAVMAVAAFAVGRALLPAVSLGARRRETIVRPWILGIGAVAATVIGLFIIEGTFEPLSAVVMAALPVWFALGVLRPRLLPGWFPGQAKTAGVVLLFVALLVALPLGIVVAERSDMAAPEGMVVVEDGSPGYGSIAPLAAGADSRFVSAGTWSAGAGRIYEFVLADPSSLAGWRDLRLEIWLGLGADNWSGIPIADPSVASPLASVPIMVEDGGHFSVTMALPLIPERDHYLAALVGTTPGGARRLLTAPQDELARWTGSVWDYLTVQRPW